MKRFILILILLIMVIAGFSCLFEERKSERLFKESLDEVDYTNDLPVPPVQIKTFNTYIDENNVLYHPYYLFDRNDFTYWIGKINNDNGRIGILRFEKPERKHKLSYIRIKTGFQGKEEIETDFSRPSKMQLHFFKLMENLSEKDELNNNIEDNIDTETKKTKKNVKKDEKEKESNKQSLTLTGKIDIELKDTRKWQLFPVDNILMDFDFVNIYIKDVFEGDKVLENVVISEIEFLVNDNTQQLEKSKYFYLYDRLSKWYEASEKNTFLENVLPDEYFYTKYEYTYNPSNLDDYFREKRKSGLPTFKTASNILDLKGVPKKQSEYLNSLPRFFDSAKALALVNSTRYSKRYRDTFFIYLDKPEFSLNQIIGSSIYFDFMEYIGDAFINPKFSTRIDSSKVLGVYLRKFFKRNPHIPHFFLVRTHNNDISGKVKYVLYYTNETVETRSTLRITGNSNDPDPKCIFIFDTEGRLAKIFSRNYDNEEHYYFIWDENNKIEKILILEVGDFGLKGIQKIRAK